MLRVINPVSYANYLSIEPTIGPAKSFRGLLFALLVSLLLHALLSVYFRDRWATTERFPTESMVPASLEIRLTSARPKVLPGVSQERHTDGIQDDGEGNPATEESAQRAVVSHQTNTDRKGVLANRHVRDLDLSIPLTDESPQKMTRSGRSTTVFDPHLAQSLEAHGQRHSAAASASIQEDSGASFVGGRWQSFVKIGKLCFEVIEADPLDSLSTDQWFPRDCG
ncbi:hypothetical protein [Congregibacter sp.]|uniref:hypothetical protein n=1 Tax=Congregibacter sp. TaxID=2744308 RepID=UPI003F6B226F